MFTVIAWYLVVLSVLCTIIPLLSSDRSPERIKVTYTGLIFQCIPMFLLAGHSLGWF